MIIKTKSGTLTWIQLNLKLFQFSKVQTCCFFPTEVVWLLRKKNVCFARRSSKRGRHIKVWLIRPRWTRVDGEGRLGTVPAVCDIVGVTCPPLHSLGLDPVGALSLRVIFVWRLTTTLKGKACSVMAFFSQNIQKGTCMSEIQHGFSFFFYNEHIFSCFYADAVQRQLVPHHLPKLLEQTQSPLKLCA